MEIKVSDELLNFAKEQFKRHDIRSPQTSEEWTDHVETLIAADLRDYLYHFMTMEEFTKATKLLDEMMKKEKEV